MMVTFKESDMNFSFDEKDVYRIEKSQLLSNVQMKAAECVCSVGNRLVFLEAKSSFSHPCSKENFDKNIQDVADKFSDSIHFLNAVFLRHADEQLPQNIKNKNFRDVEYEFVLVIKKHKEEWLCPVSDQLKSYMRHTLKLWNVPDIRVKVMTEEMARKNRYVL